MLPTARRSGRGCYSRRLALSLTHPGPGDSNSSIFIFDRKVVCLEVRRVWDQVVVPGSKIVPARLHSTMLPKHA